MYAYASNPQSMHGFQRAFDGVVGCEAWRHVLRVAIILGEDLIVPARHQEKMVAAAGMGEGVVAGDGVSFSMLRGRSWWWL